MELRPYPVLRELVMAALGSVPWVGVFLTAAQAYGDESDQMRANTLQRQWLEEHGEKFRGSSVSLG